MRELWPAKGPVTNESGRFTNSTGSGGGAIDKAGGGTSDWRDGYDVTSGNASGYGGIRLPDGRLGVHPGLRKTVHMGRGAWFTTMNAGSKLGTLRDGFLMPSDLAGM